MERGPDNEKKLSLLDRAFQAKIEGRDDKCWVSSIDEFAAIVQAGGEIISNGELIETKESDGVWTKKVKRYVYEVGIEHNGVTLIFQHIAKEKVDLAEYIKT